MKKKLFFLGLAIAQPSFADGLSLEEVIVYGHSASFYFFLEEWPSAYTRDTTAMQGEEGIVAENWVSVGLSLSTASAMAKFASAYQIPWGEPLAAHATNDGAHWGSLDGSATFLRQLPSGTSYAVFMNHTIPLEDYMGYQQQLDAIANTLP